MKPVDQIVFDLTLGDCFRACIASIFEFPITEMPNFWEETQDIHVYWGNVNDWLAARFGYKAISIVINEGHEDFVRGVLCVAFGNTERSAEEHAVVWRDGMIHDPHPLRKGLKGRPTTFAFFVPLDPNPREAP